MVVAMRKNDPSTFEFTETLMVLAAYSLLMWGVYETAVWAVGY